MDVLSSIPDTASIARLNSRKILLAGETAVSSLASGIPPGFVQQAPRDAVGGLFAQFKKDSPKAYVAVDERLLEFPKLRFALAFDGYLGWGLGERRKGYTVLFGGGESQSACSVVILVFADNRLTALYEKSLPETGSTFFRDALMAMISELRMDFPMARFVQAAPLSDWNIDGIEFIGDKPIRNLSYRPLLKKLGRQSVYFAPVGIAAAGLLLYVGAVTTGWGKYSSAVSNYEAAIADPSIQQKGGMDTSYLNIMNARRMYMDEPRRQTILADKAATIVRGIASVPGVRIMELKLPAPSLNPQSQIGMTINPDGDKARNQILRDRSPDVWVSVSLPRSGDTAMVQAKAVMTMIANNTGMSLRLPHQGWREDNSQRTFNVEGFIHD